MKKLRKFYCFFTVAFACALLLGVSAYAGETSTIGEHRKVSAELFLTDQGEVYSWRKYDGNGYFADPAKPIKIQGLSDIVEISGSLSCGVAIDSKGDLYAWGGVLKIYPFPEKILSNVVSASVSSDGFNIGAAVTADGSLYVWGEELFVGTDAKGKGLYKKIDHPYKTTGFTEAAAVCCENGGFSVIMKNGDLYIGVMPTFMKNTDLHNKALQEGPTLTNVSSISSGNYFHLALTKNGDLYTWGESWDDALGQPSGSLSTPLMKNVSAACADLAGGMAVTADGQTYLWGTVENLSEKSYFSYEVPTAFDTRGKTFVAMAAQNGTHIGMTAEGELFIWYGKDPCELLGKTGDYSPVSSEPELSRLPVGYLTSQRTIATEYVILENGDLCRMQFVQGKPKLTKVEGISNVVDVSVAHDWATVTPKSVAAVTADGSLYVWGENPYGNSLGTGDQEDKQVPTKLNLENVVSVRLSAWGHGGGALTSNGELYLWGNKYMGDNEQYSPIIETALSPYQVENLGTILSFSTIGGSEAAVTKEGDLYLWGFGAQKGGWRSTPHHRTEPYQVLKNIQSVELTYQQDYFPPGDSYAVTKDGELWHWWGSPDVQLNKLNLPPVQSMSCGATDCAAAVTQDGNVYQWGKVDRRRQGDIPPDSPPEPVEVYHGGDAVFALPGERYSQFLTKNGDLYTWKEGGTPTLTLSGVRVPNQITGSMEKLQAGSGKVYQAGQFADVDEGKWYGIQNQGTIRDAYQLGLMDGMGNGAFAPEGGLRISEALKLACAVRAAYTGDQIPAAAKGQPWYGPYLHYAVSNGMLEIGEFEDYTAYATRAQMAYLFAAALPEEVLTLSDQAPLPGDVADSDRYAQQIRLLYRAGVLQGEDASGAFHGDSGITRAQAAAIISRLALNGKGA